jgi:hypothetical protein
VSLIYGGIADVVVIVLAVVAFLEAQEKGRWVILVLTGAAFGLPSLWPSPTMSLVCFLGKIAIAMGCYIFLKWTNAPSRF